MELLIRNDRSLWRNSKRFAERVEDVLLNRRSDATRDWFEFADNIKHKGKSTDKDDSWRQMEVRERTHSLVKGIVEYIDTDTEEARKLYERPIQVIEGPPHGRNEDDRGSFGEGKDVPPQVVKECKRVMKKAVAYLLPLLKQKNILMQSQKGKILIAW